MIEQAVMAWRSKEPYDQRDYRILDVFPDEFGSNNQSITVAEFEQLFKTFGVGNLPLNPTLEAEMPPWVTFGFFEKADQAFLVVFEQAWTDYVDYGNRPVYQSVAWLVPFSQLSRNPLNFRTLYYYLKAQFPTVSAMRQVGGKLELPSLEISQLAPVIRKEAFQSVSALAAAILAQPVALSRVENLTLDERLMGLDAIFSLLPFSCRRSIASSAWLQSSINTNISLTFCRAASEAYLKATWQTNWIDLNLSSQNYLRLPKFSSLNQETGENEAESTASNEYLDTGTIRSEVSSNYYKPLEAAIQLDSPVSQMFYGNLQRIYKKNGLDFIVSKTFATHKPVEPDSFIQQLDPVMYLAQLSTATSVAQLSPAQIEQIIGAINSNLIYNLDIETQHKLVKLLFEAPEPRYFKVLQNYQSWSDKLEADLIKQANNLFLQRQINYFNILSNLVSEIHKDPRFNNHLLEHYWITVLKNKIDPDIRSQMLDYLIINNFHSLPEIASFLAANPSIISEVFLRIWLKGGKPSVSQFYQIVYQFQNRINLLPVEKLFLGDNSPILAGDLALFKNTSISLAKIFCSQKADNERYNTNAIIIFSIVLANWSELTLDNQWLQFIYDELRFGNSLARQNLRIIFEIMRLLLRDSPQLIRSLFSFNNFNEVQTIAYYLENDLQLLQTKLRLEVRNGVAKICLSYLDELILKQQIWEAQNWLRLSLVAWGEKEESANQGITDLLNGVTILYQRMPIVRDLPIFNKHWEKILVKLGRLNSIEAIPSTPKALPVTPVKPATAVITSGTPENKKQFQWFVNNYVSKFTLGQADNYDPNNFWKSNISSIRNSLKGVTDIDELVWQIGDALAKTYGTYRINNKVKEKDRNEYKILKYVVRNIVDKSAFGLGENWGTEYTKHIIVKIEMALTCLEIALPVFATKSNNYFKIFEEGVKKLIPISNKPFLPEPTSGVIDLEISWLHIEKIPVDVNRRFSMETVKKIASSIALQKSDQYLREEFLAALVSVPSEDLILFIDCIFTATKEKTTFDITPILTQLVSQLLEIKDKRAEESKQKMQEHLLKQLVFASFYLSALESVRKDFSFAASFVPINQKTSNLLKIISMAKRTK